MTYQTRTVVVFGGTGFIGRHLIAMIAPPGTVVRVPTRRPSAAAFLRTAGVVGQIVPMPVSIGDDGSVARAVQGATHVVNLLGILSPSARASFTQVHAEAAGRIARAAAAAGVERMVQISAIGADANSASAYARSKAAGEAAVRAAMPSAVVMRPSIVFGPEDQFFNRFAAMAQIAPALPLIGGGKTRFQPVYVRDVAAAIAAALDRPEAAGRTYELGGPRVYSFRELMELTLQASLRQRPLVTVPWGIAALQGRLGKLLPGKPITRDQVTLLKSDNVVTKGTPGLEALGIVPTAVEVILPTYLDRFRSGGRFAKDRKAA